MELLVGSNAKRELSSRRVAPISSVASRRAGWRGRSWLRQTAGRWPRRPQVHFLLRAGRRETSGLRGWRDRLALTSVGVRSLSAVAAYRGGRLAAG